MRQWTRIAVAGLASVATVLGGVVLPATGAVAAVDPRGVWQGVARCTSGWCAGQDFPNTWTVSTWDPASGAVTGTGGGVVTGSFVGSTFTFTDDYGYKAFVTATLSGTTFSGTWTDTNNVGGTVSGTFTPTNPATPDPGPTSPAGDRRASATGVSCNLLLPDTPMRYFSCTAMVGDAGGQAPALTPTGTVDFSVDSGGPGSLAASSCALVPSSTGGASSYCVLEYRPGPDGVPTGTQPPLTATYRGDATFAPSSGRPTSRYMTAMAALYGSNADACRSQAASPGPAFRYAFDPGLQFRNDDTWGERALKVCAVPGRGLAAVIGGVSYGAGAIGEFVGDPAIVGPQMAVGSGMMILGGETPIPPVQASAVTTGAVIVLAGGVQHYVLRPVGKGLNSMGSTIIKDPPDPRYRTPAPVAKVKPVRLPAKSSAALRHLASWKLAADRFAAYAKAFTATLDKVGGARAAGDDRWVGRQTRAAIRLAGKAKAQLVKVERLYGTVQGDVRRAIAKAGVEVTGADIAKARRAWRKGPPAGAARLLRAFGVPV